MEKKTENAGDKRRWASIIVALHVIAVLVGLPIVYKDYYFDISLAKYYYYCGCVIAMLAGLLVYALVDFKSILAGVKGRKIWKTFTATDVAVLLWGIASAISTLLSPFQFEAFWGNEGRYCGLFLILLYIAAYFGITRFFKMRPWYVDLCLAVGILVCLFGLTDFFDMDLLHFKRDIAEGMRFAFTSFTGNINLYTSLVAIYMGIAAVMWVTAGDRKKAAWYYICVWITFLALVTGVSDNAYLAIMAVFAFLPLYCFRGRMGVRRYVVLLATFFTSLKVIQWVSAMFPDRVVEIASIYTRIVGYEKLMLLIAALWIMAFGLYFFDFRLNKQEESAPPWLWRCWLGVIIAIIAGGCYVLWDVNMMGNDSRYGGLSEFLRFNDEWGSGRGFPWRLAIEDYMKFPALQKIFGYGPDTFGLMTYFQNWEEMMERGSVLFDSAHNEYLQYFVTIGPLGFLSYLAIFVTSLAAFLKRGLEKPYVAAMVFGVLGYLAQAVVNINQPATTPIMWTLLCMGALECRKNV